MPEKNQKHSGPDMLVHKREKVYSEKNNVKYNTILREEM